MLEVAGDPQIREVQGISTFGKAKGGGRRKAARAPAPLLATLSTVTDDFQVGLVNLSSTGAQVSAPRLPAGGEEVIFRADKVQSFGQVIWSQKGQCGVAFETPIPMIDVARLRDDPNIWRFSELTAEQMAAAEAWELGVSA